MADLATQASRVVAEADADPESPLVAAGDSLYWVDTAQRKDGALVQVASGPTVRELNLATGQMRKFAWSAVYPSPDHTFVYAMVSEWRLAAFRPDGSRIGPIRRPPSGWFLDSSEYLQTSSPVTAGGVLVWSSPNYQAVPLKTSRTLGLWDLASGTVRVLGQAWQVVGTFTAPGASDSTIAWLPGNCPAITTTPGVTSPCALQLTNTSDLSTRTIQAPPGYSFDYGGSFSPDGTRLAIVVYSYQGGIDRTARVAVVDCAAGTIQGIPGAEVAIGWDLLAWVLWLPDGSGVIAPGVRVDLSTGAVAPLRLAATAEDEPNNSAVVFSAPA